MMTPLVSPLLPEDRIRWLVLAREYKGFYKTEVFDFEYETTWRRLLDGGGIFGFGARVDGELVGIAHYLFHTSA